MKVLQIDVGFKHDVLICSKGIAETFKNSKYVNPQTKVLQVVLRE
jgi:hypothetical protein